MNKYKLVGAISLLLGLLQAFTSIAFLFFTLPRLMSLYSDFESKPPSYASIYFGVGFVFLMAIANLFLAFKLFSTSENKRDRFFIYAIILIVITFILTGFFTSIASITAILPIYNLTTHL